MFETASPKTVHAFPRVVAALEAVCLGLLGALAIAGAALLLGKGDIRWQALHVRSADLLVPAALGLVVASYASGIHRLFRTRWWAHCLLLLSVLGEYVLGDAAVQDAYGAAGREHIGAVVGATPGPLLALALHALVGIALVGAALLFLPRRVRLARDTRAGRADALCAGGAALLAAMAAVMFPSVSRAPMLTLATVPTPPWPAFALVPLEARMPLIAALALFAGGFALLLLVPFVDRSSRPPWVRRFTSSMLALLLLTFLSLMFVGALVPETTHLT